MKTRSKRSFRAKVRDAEQLRQTGLEDATGDVELVVAIFDIPDTHPAQGNTRPQVIDRGAFDDWLSGHDFDNDPPLGFVDHGGAIETGGYSTGKLIGFASAAKATDEGLLLRCHYNLDKQVAREAFSDLLHNPKGVQFSFAWSDDTTELRDGVEHVTKIDLLEWSQVAIAAQRQAHLVDARAKASQLGGTSLEELPNEVRGSWWEQRESIFHALEGWAYVAEVFATNDDRSEGFVVVAFDDGRFGKVPWMRMEDDTIGFDTSKSEELEQEWVTTGKGLTGDEDSRAAALATRSDEALREAGAEATTARSENSDRDLLKDFYREVLSRA